MANPSETQPILPGLAALAGSSSMREINDPGKEPGLVFAELPHLGKLNLRGGVELATPVKQVTGCDFPPPSNHFLSAGVRHTVWLGPDEFLLLCEAGKEKLLEQQLKRSNDRLSVAVTDVTDSLCAFLLDGPAARQVLAKGCSLDLHPNIFTAGSCAQTLLALAGITLMATDDNTLIVICRTSFAHYLQKWLYDAALEYGVAFNNERS